MISGSASPEFFGAAGAAATGGGAYQVSRSLRFSAPDSSFLSRTPGSASNRRTWTLSLWIKRNRTVSGEEIVFQAGSTSISSGSSRLVFANDQLDVRLDGNNNGRRLTTAVFRDFSAWYHILLAVDTTQATAANRIKLYVNGSQQTVFSSSSDTDQNFDTAVNSTERHLLGVGANSGGTLDSGFSSIYLADTFLVSGLQLEPSSFAETNAITGQWVPKAYSGSYGTNGFRLAFDSYATTAALGTDSSGAGNNWTVNNFSVQGILNYSSNVTTVATSIYNGTPATMFDGSTSTYYGVESNTGNSLISIDLSGKGVSASTSIRVYSSFRTGMVWQINGSTVSSSGVTHPNVGWQTLSGWSSGTINSLSVSVPINNASQVYAVEVDGVVLVNNSGSGNDSLVDTPTSYGTDTGVGGEVRGNYATLNLLDNDGNTLGNGNLELAGSGNTYRYSRSSIYASSGKWYWECLISATGGETRTGPQILRASDTLGAHTTGNIRGYINISDYAGTIYVSSNPNGSNTNLYTTSGSLPAGTIVGIALDATNGKLWISVNGTWLNSGNPDTDSNPVATGLTGPYTPGGWAYNSSDLLVYNFGQRSFSYTSNHTTFKTLCDTNLPAPVVAKGSTAMDVVLYTGNGAARNITGLAFNPDLVWIKARDIGYDPRLADSVRGAGKELFSNNTDAEETNAANGYVSAFNSDGFALEAGIGVNRSGSSFVAWTWDAGTSTVTNTAGSITGGAQVRANPSSGFSVVTYTGNLSGNGNVTVGHGLGVAPQLIITKARSGSSRWAVQMPTALSANNYLELNTTAAQSSWGTQTRANPTSTVFDTIYAGGVNESGVTYVAYCFAPVSGYSSFGSYTGNGSTDGPFVYTGFRPKFFMHKDYTAGGANRSWLIWDAARETYNAEQAILFANSSAAESSNSEHAIDFVSNGIKIRNSNVNINPNGVGFIYMAFAENPFQYARAR